jgi:hypothetical protein
MSALSATHASYSHVAIDTLAYAKKLKAAGVPETQAEIHAEALAETIDTHLATKQDIKDLKHDIKELKHNAKEMEKRLAYQLSVRFGSMLAAAVTILPIFLKLLHFFTFYLIITAEFFQ